MVKIEQVPPQQLKNYFKSIAEHKDILKLQMMLSNAISHTRPKIHEALKMFSHFQYLWEEDRSEVVKVNY